jgi:hypothetical protein
MNYVWSFPEVTVVYSEDNLIDVISVSFWRLTATDGAYSSSAYGSIALGKPNPASFTPFQQVTPEQLQEWTETALGEETVTRTKVTLAQQIEQKKNPTSGNVPPPWGS